MRASKDPEQPQVGGPGASSPGRLLPGAPLASSGCPSHYAPSAFFKGLTRTPLVPGGKHLHVKPPNVGSERNLKISSRVPIFITEKLQGSNRKGCNEKPPESPTKEFRERGT